MHEPYGGPAALQRFVDACHARGLGVCLDVVYNHLGPDGNYLGEFGPYFTDRYETPWGQALNLDGADSDEVRALRRRQRAACGCATSTSTGCASTPCTSCTTTARCTVLEELSREVDALAARGRPAAGLIAESDRNDPRDGAPRGPGRGRAALGLHAQWADDVHHALHVALTGETQGYYADFADARRADQGARARRSSTTAPGRRSGSAPTAARSTPSTLPGWRFVASLQTHDQVGNRATGRPALRACCSTRPAGLRGGAAAHLAPCTPMLFMGEEWGASTPWQYFTDHTDPELAAAPCRRDGKNEFASHGWDRDDVPDPQAAETVERSRLDWSEPAQRHRTRGCSVGTAT